MILHFVMWPPDSTELLHNLAIPIQHGKRDYYSRREEETTSQPKLNRASIIDSINPDPSINIQGKVG